MVLLSINMVLISSYITCIMITFTGIAILIAGYTVAFDPWNKTHHIFTVAGVLIVIYGIMGFIPPTVATETYQVDGQVTYEKQEQNVYFVEPNADGTAVRKDFDTTSDVIVEYKKSKNDTNYVKITIEKKLINFNKAYVTKMVVYTPEQGTEMQIHSHF